MSGRDRPSPRWNALLRRWLAGLLARKWFDVGLRGKMSALVTVGLTGLIAIFGLIGITTVRQATQQLLAEHVLRARILAESLDSKLGQIGGSLTILSSQIDMDHPEASLQVWKQVLDEDFRSVQGVYLFDKDSNLIAGTEGAPDINWEGVPVMGLIGGDYARLISTQGLPRPYAVIAAPVFQSWDPAPAGALAALLDLSNPDIFLANSSLGLEHNGTFQVLGSNGQVLASSPPDRSLTPATLETIVQELFVGGKPTVEACLGCTRDVLEETTGTVIAFAPLKQAPWGVVIWHDSAELFAPVRRLGMQTLVLGALTMLGAFFLV